VKHLQVLVRDNNVDQALRVLKKKMQREGLFREMKRCRFYEKPSDKAAREKSEAIRRRRKLARKQAVRDGLIKAPPKKRTDKHQLASRAAPVPPSQAR
jgi:small subunit ribosomal protein S21